jgi:uncharacterized membrane protein YoaK (UPF0700 family)
MPVSRNAFLVLLAAVAGWVDALSFSELGSVFTSFQSGNLIFLGLAIDQGDTEQLVGAAVSLTAFLAGTALGAYAVGRAGVEWPDSRRLLPAFVLEWVLLVGCAICWRVFGTPAGDSAERIALLALAALAMGAQGAAVLALHIRGVVTNAMTATLMLGGVLVGLHAHGRSAAQGASPLPAAIVAAVCGSYTVSALLVGAIDMPELMAAVPAAVLALFLAWWLAGLDRFSPATARRASG